MKKIIRKNKIHSSWHEIMTLMVLHPGELLVVNALCDSSNLKRFVTNGFKLTLPEATNSNAVG